MGGWSLECRKKNNMLVYAARMQMIGWGRELIAFARHQASRAQPRSSDETVGRRPEIYRARSEGLFDLAPLSTGSDVHHSVFGSVSFCSAPYHYKFWFGEFKHALPEDGGGVGGLHSRVGREEAGGVGGGAPRWQFPCFSGKTEEDQGGFGAL